jgi:hypothetical protein
LVNLKRSGVATYFSGIGNAAQAVNHKIDIGGRPVHREDVVMEVLNVLLGDSEGGNVANRDLGSWLSERKSLEKAA